MDIAFVAAQNRKKVLIFFGGNDIESKSTPVLTKLGSSPIRLKSLLEYTYPDYASITLLSKLNGLISFRSIPTSNPMLLLQMATERHVLFS